jgi:hypothetical protein
VEGVEKPIVNKGFVTVPEKPGPEREKSHAAQEARNFPKLKLHFAAI